MMLIRRTFPISFLVPFFLHSLLSLSSLQFSCISLNIVPIGIDYRLPTGKKKNVTIAGSRPLNVYLSWSWGGNPDIFTTPLSFARKLVLCLPLGFNLAYLW